MAFRDLFTSRSSVQQLPTTSPQQTQVMNQLLQTLSPQLGQMQSFEPVAEAAQQRFAQQTAPSIAERFAGIGAQRSSGYNQALANAQRDLQTQLAGQEAQFGLSQQNNLANLLQLALQPQFENIYQQGGPTGLSRILELLGHTGAGIATGGASVPFSAGMLGAGSGGDYSGLQNVFGDIRSSLFGS